MSKTAAIATSLATSLSTDALDEIAKIATKLTGVQLNEKHYTMIQSRLIGRLQELGLANFEQYLVFVNKNFETESKVLISNLTTHHTYFFREGAHFNFINEKALNHLIAKARSRADKTIRIWSAASSRGQEVYTLAMSLTRALKTAAPDVKIDILGTDIDPESVKISKNGVYLWNEVKEIPLQYLSADWARGTGDISDYAKVKSHLRTSCRFEVMNLFNLNLKPSEKFDIIFCRNVFIYFTPEQIKTITQKMLPHLEQDGLLFLGISESLNGLSLPVKLIGPSIYAKADSVWLKQDKPKVTSERPSGVTEEEKPIRVMVVDDSASIHTLMKHVFTPESGFVIVANAMNGLEAAQKLKTTAVDVITLDIHMPEQDGVEYLRSNFNSSHPPVVMVSSVSREDSSLAAQALEIGASDYVEKPMMNNLQERADEIRTKLRCAYFSKKTSTAPKSDLALDRSFQKAAVLDNVQDKGRVLFLQGSDRARAKKLISEFSSVTQPPLLLVVDASMQGSELIKNQIEKEIGRRFKGADDLAKEGPKVGETYVLFASDNLPAVLDGFIKNRKTSIMQLGSSSAKLSQLIRAGLKPSGSKILLEEMGAQNSKNSLKDLGYEYSPITGFHYLSDQHLCKK